MNHPNTAVVDGKIYVLGGLGVGAGQWPNWQAIGDCYVYCPVGKTWESLGPMPKGTERGAAAVGVSGSKIYVAGGLEYLGIAGQKTLSVSSVYDTRTGVWTPLPDLPEGRDHAGAAVVRDSFYVVGGRINGNGIGMRDTVFALDIAASRPVWKTRTARMPTRRGGLSAAAIGDVIYTFGGEGNEESETGVFNQTEAYDTERDFWTKLRPMQVPRHGTSATSADGGVYIPGGGVHQNLGATDHFDVFKP
jgi:N-acetylneuraminic acid mutarotase